MAPLRYRVRVIKGTPVIYHAPNHPIPKSMSPFLYRKLPKVNRSPEPWWVRRDQMSSLSPLRGEALQSADVRTRCARLRARWRTGAPGSLRAPNSRSRPEAVHSRRESHQNRKDSNGGHALACASSQPARRRRPARGRSGSVVTIPPRGDKSWPLGSNGTCTVALTKRLDHMK
jgi:hypothetical protein